MDVKTAGNNWAFFGTEGPVSLDSESFERNAVAHRKFIGVFAAALMAFWTPGEAVTPGWQAEITQSVPTASGAFQILSIGTGSQFRLGGKFIAEMDASSPYVAATLPQG